MMGVFAYFLPLTCYEPSIRKENSQKAFEYLNLGVYLQSLD